ncbi:MAG: tetratricopeptide repeat protein [Candidatus Kapaibacterium sp.]
MMPQNNELRLFISSTFRDMQEEREHLVKKIFPEIRALCRQRGVTFTDVDLRWGLTDEQAALGTVIRTCLEEVDKCRPFFIGIIGNRYGWIPELHDVLMDPELLTKYPFVEELAIEGTSVTEMEFIHGVFDAPEINGEYSFFYHCNGDIAEADHPERLGALIDRTRSTGRPFRDYTNVEELGQAVRDDLLRVIEQHWPEEDAPSELDRERRSHAAFAASRTRAYIPNPIYLKEFTTWLGEGETPLVITGESGLGKSSLAAYLTDYYHRKHRDAFVIAHYVGASPSSGTAVAVIRHIVEAIRVRFEIAEELPSRPEELQQSFANWLFRCHHLAEKEGVGVLIVIDAVNQLDELGQQMAWLPQTIPPGLKLVISTTPGVSGEHLAERGWSDLGVEPLADERIRQSIVVRYLGEFRKGIGTEQIRRVIGNEKASSPLYLRVVAEELRLHGEHETLDEVVNRYSGAADLLAVFDLMLERMERDYGDGRIRDLLSLITSSASGLSEEDLLELMGISRLDLSRLLFSFDYHLLQRDGLLSFFHDYLHRAVETRYLADEQKKQATHRRLAEYFESCVSAAIAERAGVPTRIAGELMYQLNAIGEIDRLHEFLATMPVFLALFTGTTRYDVLGYWSSLEDRSEIDRYYREGVDRWELADGAERSVGVGQVVELLEVLSRWSSAIDHCRERLSSAVEREAITEEAESRWSLGGLLHLRGEYDNALKELEQALNLYTKLGDRQGIAMAHGHIGVVYMNRGEYDRALESLGVELRISEELGDRRGVAKAHANMGIVYNYRGEYDRALESLGVLLRVSEELGDRRLVAKARGNIGIVYAHNGEHEKVLESFGVKLRISEELGDRRGVANAHGNMSRVYSERGEHERALEGYTIELRMSEELGDRNSAAIARGNLGNVYHGLGKYEQALEQFTMAMAVHRQLGYRYGLIHWLKGTIELFLDLVENDRPMPESLSEYVPGAEAGTWQTLTLSKAREQAEEFVAVSEELSIPDMLLDGQVLLARITAAQGDQRGALSRLAEILAVTSNDDHRAELHYWRWKLEPTNADDRTEAFALYQSLIDKRPKPYFRERLKELSASTFPATPEANDAAE